MNKQIWASFDDYLPLSRQHKLLGKGVANYHFFDALLRYGHFDEYHFFLVNQAHKKAFEKAHKSLFETANADAKIKIFYRTQLPDAVRQYDYTVFHQSDHIVHFNNLCHFRNQMGSFPVTSFIHSISYPSMMVHLQEMAFGGVTSQDAIICSSEAGKKVLKNWFEQIEEMRHLSPPPVKMEVISFGFDSREFDQVSREKARRILEFRENQVIGLCFGRFSEYDKMDLFPLLQAFRAIYQKGRAWRLILAGAAHHPEYVSMVDLWVKALGLKDAIIIQTDISDINKIALFKSADFFVSPSDNLQETFGLTLVEAMAAGLPLIVSDFSGYREIATPDCARLVPTRWCNLDLFSKMEFGALADEVALHRYIAQSVSVDIDDLADAIYDLFTHPKKRADMGEVARKRFDEQYAYSVIIDRLEAFWLKLKKDFRRDALPAKNRPLFPDYFRSFSHYFTTYIGPDDVVKSTDFAITLLHSKQDYPLLPGMDQVVDSENIRAIIAHATEPRTMQDILNQVGRQREKGYYQIMWMIKHGLLALSPGTNS